MDEALLNEIRAIVNGGIRSGAGEVRSGYRRMYDPDAKLVMIDPRVIVVE